MSDWRNDVHTLLNTDCSSPAIIAVHDHWLYFTGSQQSRAGVCVVNLREFKKKQRQKDDAISVFVLDTEDDTTSLDFPVTELRVNNDGSLLAVVGTNDLVVIKVPCQRLAHWTENNSTTNNKNENNNNNNNTTTTNIQCESYCILDIDLAPNGTSILKTIWHPLSSTVSHLLLLTSDGRLRMYDIYSSLNEPELSMSFLQDGVAAAAALNFPTSNLTNGTTFSAVDEQSYQIVSFCIGSTPTTSVVDHLHTYTDIWSLFTVYGLMKNGDIYALCPVLPLSCVLTEQQMKNLSLAVINEHSDSSSILARNQRSFLRSLLSNVDPINGSSSFISSTIINEDKDLYTNEPFNLNLLSDFDSLSRSSHSANNTKLLVSAPVYPDLAPSPLGPALLSPLSHNVKLDNPTIQARDIVMLPSSPFNVIAVTWNNGLVDLWIEIDKPVATWGRATALDPVNGSFTVSQPNSSYIPTAFNTETGVIKSNNRSLTLVLYEIVDTGLIDRFEHTQYPHTLTIPNNDTKLVLDVRYPDTLYVLHAGGLHSICIAPWIHKLIDTNTFTTTTTTTTDDNNDNIVLENISTSEVSRIITTATNKDTNQQNNITPIGITSIGATLDPYLGMTLFACTANRELAALELHYRIDNKPSTTTPSSILQNTPSTSTTLMDLTSPPFVELERMARVAATPAMLQGSLVPENTTQGVSEEQLTMVGQYVTQFVTQGQTLKTTGAIVVAGVTTLRTLSATTDANLIALTGATNKCMAASDVQEKRASKLRDEISEQMDVQDMMLQALFDVHTPELTATEKEYIRELRQVEVKYQEVDAKSKKIKKQADMILREVKSTLPHTTTNEQTLSDEFVTNVSSILEQHSSLLEDIQSQLRQLTIQADSALAR